MSDQTKTTALRDTIGNFLFWFDKSAYASPGAAADALMHRLALGGFSIVETLEQIANASQGRRRDAMWKEIGP
jgi:hypothetical protein